MKAAIKVENGELRKALNEFLRQLLETGTVEALLLPMRTPGGAVTPALVVDPALLDDADPLAPVLPVNGATPASMVSGREPRPKTGIVGRSCELRAFIELVKLKQASLDDAMLIAVDCAGTYSVPNFIKNGSPGGLELYWGIQSEALNGEASLRAACQVCEQPVFNGAQVTVEVFGSDLDCELRLELPDELGERLGLALAAANGRAAVIDRLVAQRITRRDAVFAGMRQRLEGEGGLSAVMAACIRCHNCMNVCPICYCKTCVFKSQVFDHAPAQYLHWAKQKGACRVPADMVLFHLTRLNHMALSCIGCGMCTEACPAELPVGMVFRTIGQRLQETFEYQPGHSLEESLPLVTFKADEWNQVGE